MTKLTNEDVLSNILLNVTDKNLTIEPRQLEEIIHDIRSSSSSFLMLVESMEKDLKATNNPRDNKKLQQITAHAHRNKKIIEIVIAALLKSQNAKDPK